MVKTDSREKVRSDRVNLERAKCLSLLVYFFVLGSNPDFGGKFTEVWENLRSIMRGWLAPIRGKRGGCEALHQSWWLGILTVAGSINGLEYGELAWWLEVVEKPLFWWTLTLAVEGGLFRMRVESDWWDLWYQSLYSCIHLYQTNLLIVSSGPPRMIDWLLFVHSSSRMTEMATRIVCTSMIGPTTWPTTWCPFPRN